MVPFPVVKQLVSDVDLSSGDDVDLCFGDRFSYLQSSISSLNCEFEIQFSFQNGIATRTVGVGAVTAG